MKNRKSIRLQKFDYSQPAAYFITICAHQFQEHWGEVANANCKLNDWGAIVKYEWDKTAELRPNVTLDAFVLMPNHLHGIIILHPEEGNRADFYYPNFRSVAPQEKIQEFGKLVPNSIPRILNQFKSSVTQKVRKAGFSLAEKHWQRGYYERVVRNPKELENIRNYIYNNPSKWEEDEEYFKKLLQKMDLII